MTCPTCNSPVTVEGHTTNYYVPSGSNIEDGQAGAAKWAQERLERYGIVEQAVKELNERLRARLKAAEEALREAIELLITCDGDSRSICEMEDKARAYFASYGEHGDKS